MKKEGTQKKIFILSLFLLSLFLINIIAIGLVSAEDNNPLFDPVLDMFTKWGEGDFSVTIAKYIFLIILVALIYSILGTISLFNRSRGILFIISFLVSFLAIAFITPNEIYLMLVSYTALGFILSAMLPFFILLFFSVQTAKKGGAGGRILTKIMWFGFIGFLIYKLVMGITSKTSPLPLGGSIAYLAFIILSIIYIFVLQKSFIKAIFNEEIESAQQILERKTKLQKAKRDTESKSMESETKP